MQTGTKVMIISHKSMAFFAQMVKGFTCMSIASWIAEVVMTLADHARIDIVGADIIISSLTSSTIERITSLTSLTI